jgi:Tfp pilus assembly protein PilV
MHPRARKAPSDEDGFIIIEVLVSALILAIVAGAVLTLIAATTRGAAAQRNRSVAYDLAQADQARLRMLRIFEISGVESKETKVTRNGTVYTVTSERVYVNNKAGAVSCVEGSETPDYVQLTSTVTATPMVQPVVLQSVVSPSTGSLDLNLGKLAASTVNAVNEPVSGVTVTLPSLSKQATTGTAGCAMFLSVPAATYTATYEGKNLVNENGENSATEQVEVAAGKLKRVGPMAWDYPATLEPEFVYLDPSTGKPRPAPVDSMTVINATHSLSLPVGTPGNVLRSKTQVKALFPFKSSEYTVYAGSCASNNPGTAPANASGLYSAEAKPKALLTPQIHVPALELTVTNAIGAYAAGARVTVTDANSTCKYNGSSIKRIFTANAVGHLSNKAAGETEAGLPFGTYNICASLKVGSEYQSAKAEAVKVENLTSVGTTLALKLATGGKECP